MDFRAVNIVKVKDNSVSLKSIDGAHVNQPYKHQVVNEGKSLRLFYFTIYINTLWMNGKDQILKALS
jgi:hypothetical protein